jgi:hypothetical protein
MSKRKARIMFFKAVSVGTLVLLGVCTYQLFRLVEVMQQLNVKFDLFDVVDKLLRQTLRKEWKYAENAHL